MLLQLVSCFQYKHPKGKTAMPKPLWQVAKNAINKMHAPGARCWIDSPVQNVDESQNNPKTQNPKTALQLFVLKSKSSFTLVKSKRFYKRVGIRRGCEFRKKDSKKWSTKGVCSKFANPTQKYWELQLKISALWRTCPIWALIKLHGRRTCIAISLLHACASIQH